ncbi:MAG: hypothetical protein P8Z35_14305 [Ignavibacteriaceae bacterium]
MNGQKIKWSDDAVNSINDKTLAEDYIDYNKNAAIVKTGNGKYREALKDLLKVKDIVAPWSSDFWLTLGKVYENLNRNKDALNAYITGLVAYRNPLLMKSAEKFASEKEIQNEIKKMKEKLSSVEPGKFQSSQNKDGNVVLAELFTGAECGPCVAADRAFDELSEYFPRTALAILEYHVHIPGPDPLTNPDSYPMLHIALAEKYVKYSGANGIDKHLFVVRKLVDDPAGIKLSSLNETISKEINIRELKDNITSYLKDPTKDPSWRMPSFHGWRSGIDVLEKIDTKNLALVVWVQDADTKQVLQAHYMDVK